MPKAELLGRYESIRYVDPANAFSAYDGWCPKVAGFASDSVCCQLPMARA